MIYKIINDRVRQNCINEIQSLPEGKYQVDIKEVKRSNEQNRFYWKVLEIISEETGYERDELHDALKRKFIGVDQGKDIFGNLYLKPKSSAKLKKGEFTTYLNKVIAFAYSLEINIPTPDHYGLTGS